MERRKLESASARKPFIAPVVREGNGLTDLTQGNAVLVSGPQPT